MNQRSPRLLSAQEFLEEYQKNGPVEGDSSDSKKSAERPNRRNRRKNSVSGSESSATSAESGNADKKWGKKGKNVGSEPGERGKAVGLRVIGGKFRAVRLEYSGDHRVRPMKDRIRESVFNLIGPSVEGKHVVDLFTGTGALAFEALSRGAVSATLIEIHFPTARVTRNNIAALDAKEPGIAEKIDLITTDVFFWGRTLSGEKKPKVTGIAPGAQRPLPTDIPWLVFCSPPYDFYIERQADLLALLESVRSAAPSGSLFVIEADERFDFDLLGVPIPPKKRKSYSPAEIALFTV